MARFAVYSQEVNATSPEQFGLWSEASAFGGTDSYTPVAVSVDGVSIKAAGATPLAEPVSWQPVQGGIPVAPTVTLTPPATSIYQTGFAVSYAAGGDVLQQITADTSTSVVFNLGATYTPAAPYQNLCLLGALPVSGPFFWGSTDLGVGIYANINMTVVGNRLTPNEDATLLAWPIAGTFQGMAIVYSATAGDTFTLSLRKNGTDVWTVTLPDTGGSPSSPLIDTTTTVSVSPGDIINYKAVFASGTDLSAEANHQLNIYSLVLGFRSP